MGCAHRVTFDHDKVRVREGGEGIKEGVCVGEAENVSRRIEKENMSLSMLII